MESDLTELTASQLAAAIATGACSAQEAAQSFLDRIDAVDPALNAMITTTACTSRSSPAMRTATSALRR